MGCRPSRRELHASAAPPPSREGEAAVVAKPPQPLHRAVRVPPRRGCLCVWGGSSVYHITVAAGRLFFAKSLTTVAASGRLTLSASLVCPWGGVHKGKMPWAKKEKKKTAKCANRITRHDGDYCTMNLKRNWKTTGQSLSNYRFKLAGHIYCGENH